MAGYNISHAELVQLNTDRDTQKLLKLGGVTGLARLLETDCHAGVDPSPDAGPWSVAARRQLYGANKFKEAPSKSFFLLLFLNFQDPIILLLCAAAALSTVLGAAIPEERAHNGWIEGVAIWVAVFLVTGVGAANDYQKDQQFRKLNAQKDKIMVKVIRGKQQMLVENTEIVVGDVMLLDTGDKVVADGVVIDSQGLVLDEASLTGESDPIKKSADEDPWVRSGTQVSDGSGKMLIVAVGPDSEWGKTMTLVSEAGDDMTPLQHKLAHVAAIVGKIGASVAVACFIALLVKWCVVNRGFPVSKINQNGPVQFFLYCVTIIVVAIPEGLPLAVTISLAYSMKKMMKDNNFVRVLAACETMGGATAICSDKTGTLTENRMTVVEGWFCGKQLDHAPITEEVHPDVLEHLKMNIALNSKAFLLNLPDGRIDFVGNRTECALLILLRKWGLNYQDIREQHEAETVRMYGFSSAKKMASVLVRVPGALRLYNKGAAEWVLRKSTAMHKEDGSIEQLDDEKRTQLMDEVTGMAMRGLRCICLTYTDYPPETEQRADGFLEDSDNLDQNLTVLAIVGIKDPVRQEVPQAVATCKKAGIVVRMVTGDNIHTARHIARECGILFEADHVALEGPDFRVMPPEKLLQILPKVRVLARSSPEDKLTLVRFLKKQGEVVAVTGDGTNDAPALKESDVGLAMGIAGTEVAKEAADIVILDDNFSSIVKSVLWGRSVFCNIRKFLQFQLTVNFVALVIAFFGAVIGGHEPLNVLQLLWVNLIMDTMGALALATETPHPSLLDHKPYGRQEQLINRKIWKHIFVQGCYQIFWMFLFLYGLPKSNIVDGKYFVHPPSYFFDQECGSRLLDAGRAVKFTGPLSNSTVPSLPNGSPLAVDYCSVLNDCGFPFGNSSNSACGLYQDYWRFTTSGKVPGDLLTAVCQPFGFNQTACTPYSQVVSARRFLDDEFIEYEDSEYKKPLSILFNAFIMCQLANEINARRIDDEYNIFAGLFSNWIFMSVLAITAGLQLVIIYTPINIFFKVVPLSAPEFFVTVAIGLGAIPVSLLTRFISRSLIAKRNRVYATPPQTPQVELQKTDVEHGIIHVASMSKAASLGRYDVSTTPQPQIFVNKQVDD